MEIWRKNGKDFLSVSVAQASDQTIKLRKIKGWPGQERTAPHGRGQAVGSGKEIPKKRWKR